MGLPSFRRWLLCHSTRPHAIFPRNRAAFACSMATGQGSAQRSTVNLLPHQQHLTKHQLSRQHRILRIHHVSGAAGITTTSEPAGLAEHAEAQVLEAMAALSLAPAGAPSGAAPQGAHPGGGKPGPSMAQQPEQPRLDAGGGLEAVAEYIGSGHARNIVFAVGAGISVSAGIPDFRTPGTGACLFAHVGGAPSAPPLACMHACTHAHESMYMDGLQAGTNVTFRACALFTSTAGSVCAMLASTRGCPDYHAGLYSQLSKYGLPYPEAVFDISYFRNISAKPFYMLAKVRPRTAPHRELVPQLAARCA